MTSRIKRKCARIARARMRDMTGELSKNLRCLRPSQARRPQQSSSSSAAASSAATPVDQEHRVSRSSASGAKKRPQPPPPSSQTSATAASVSTAKRRRPQLLDLENPNSPLAKIELKTLINPATFAKLPPDSQRRLLPLFPPCDVQQQQRNSHQQQQQLSSGPPSSSQQLERGALCNEFLSGCLVQFSRRLRAGEFRGISAATDARAKTAEKLPLKEPSRSQQSQQQEDQDLLLFAKPRGAPPVAAKEKQRRRRRGEEGGGGRPTSAEPNEPRVGLVTAEHPGSEDNRLPKAALTSATATTTRTRTLAAVRESLRARRAAYRQLNEAAAAAASVVVDSRSPSPSRPSPPMPPSSVGVGLPTWSKSARQQKLLLMQQRQWQSATGCPQLLLDAKDEMMAC